MLNKSALYGARSRTCVSLETANMVKLKLLSEALNLKISHVIDDAVARYFEDCEQINEADKKYMRSLGDAGKK